MIFVTSAKGTTGRHMIAALVAKDLPVRALVHSHNRHGLTGNSNVLSWLLGVHRLHSPNTSGESYKHADISG